MKRKIKCSNCSKTFENNDQKHRFRTKYSPCCKAPYSKPSAYIPGFDFRIREKIAKLFSFFKSKEEIWYVCPKCQHVTVSYQGMKLARVPVRFSLKKIGGILQQVPTSYRVIPQCPKCRTYMTRRKHLNSKVAPKKVGV